MTWVRIDDQFGNHPKVGSLGYTMLACVGLHTLALCYCNEYLTDGFIPKDQVPRLAGDLTLLLPDGTPWQLVNRLVDVNLWEETEGGYRIHDYLDYNPSRRQVMQLRKTRASVGQAGGRASAKQKASKKQTTAEASANQKSTPVPVPVPVPSQSQHPSQEGTGGGPGEDPLRPPDGFTGWPPEWEKIQARIQTLPFLDRYQAWLTDLDWWRTQDEKFEAVPATLDHLLCGAVAYITSTRYKPRTRVGLLKKLHNCLEVEARKAEREAKTRQG